MGLPNLRTKLPFSKDVINSPGGGFYNVNRITTGEAGAVGGAIQWARGGGAPYPYLTYEASSFLPSTEASFSFWAKATEVGTFGGPNEWEGPGRDVAFFRISEAAGSGDTVLGCSLTQAGLLQVGAGGTFPGSFYYNVPAGGGELIVGGWNHIFATYNGGNPSASRMRCWINGTEVSLTLNWGSPTSLTQDGRPLYMRANEDNESVTPDSQDPGGSLWLMDEVALWDSDESANASAIYNGGATQDLTTFSPEIYISFDGVTDLSAIPNLGTLGGTGEVINSAGRVSIVEDTP